LKRKISNTLQLGCFHKGFINTSQRDSCVNTHSRCPCTSRRTSMANQSIYDFSAETLDGEQVPLSIYAGKVLLIVNVATF
uniref:Glutathione peroxidase n=1 Tax=Kryptolebias marmoratus TaxID=37003 RepID=A0A3Q3AQW7_KRYMA